CEPANHAAFLERQRRWREQRHLGPFGPFHWPQRRRCAVADGPGDGELRAERQQRWCWSDPPADFRSKLAAVRVKPAAHGLNLLTSGDDTATGSSGIDWIWIGTGPIRSTSARVPRQSLPTRKSLRSGVL